MTDLEMLTSSLRLSALLFLALPRIIWLDKPVPDDTVSAYSTDSKGKIMKENKLYCVQDGGNDEKLLSAIQTIGTEHPIRLGDGKNGIKVSFSKTASPGTLCMARKGQSVSVSYSETNMALRALASILSDLIPDGETVCESSPFASLGIMLDCSRNAVMTVGHFKKWMTKLALLGYNMAMLYTEDTYQLLDEPFFGFMRGAYSSEELAEMDAFASSLGIEMIPCIQTLGHLEQVLFWPEYHSVKDTNSVILVDSEKTYALIDKMIGHWAKLFKTRRIHVGMDETHDLGRGKFMDLHGHQRGFDIFNRHLEKVVEICKKHGLSPMIWSDMYFRMGSKTNEYYDKKCEIPQNVVDAIPKEAGLVYWDYYHEDKDFYLDWISRHRAMGFEPLMASGVWTWVKFFCDIQKTEQTAIPCVEACRESGVKEVFFTMWGDDGGYCDWDSAFAGLAIMAEKAFSDKNDGEALCKRFASLFGSDLDLSRTVSQMNSILSPTAILWDDPLMMIHQGNEKLKNDKALSDAASKFREISRQIERKAEGGTAGDFKHIKLLLEFLADKLDLADLLISSYAQRDRKSLRNSQKAAAALIKELAKLAKSFRKLWYSTCKPFGFETMQIRLAGQRARLEELVLRIDSVLERKSDSIPELDAGLKRKAGHVWGAYNALSTGTRIH